MTAFDVTEQLRQGVDRVRVRLALTKLQNHARISQRMAAEPCNQRLLQALRRAWAELADLAPEVRLIEQSAHAAELPITDLSLAQVYRFLGWPTASPARS